MAIAALVERRVPTSVLAAARITLWAAVSNPFGQRSSHPGGPEWLVSPFVSDVYIVPVAGGIGLWVTVIKSRACHAHPVQMCCAASGRLCRLQARVVLAGEPGVG